MLAKPHIQPAVPTVVSIVPRELASNEKPRVLVVQDDPYVSAVIWTLLNQFNFDVISETSGLEGLELARTRRPDIVVLDVNLPGLNGLEVCHRLKADPETCALPVVFCSAQRYLADESLEVGAVAFFDKSNDVINLPQSLRRILAARLPSLGG